MTNEQKTPRTLVEDLPVAEQELNEKAMEDVQGGVTSVHPNRGNIKNQSTLSEKEINPMSAAASPAVSAPVTGLPSTPVGGGSGTP